MRRLHHALAVLLCLLTIASCGVPQDDSPRVLSAEDIPDALVVGRLPTPTPGSDGPLQVVYLVGPDNRLAGVLRDVEPTPDAVLQSLLIGTTTAEAERGITSALVRSVEIVDINVNPLFQLATVTLGPGSLGNEELLVFGQLVFTLTELDDIESVIFERAASEEDAPETADESEQLSVRTDLGLSPPGEQIRRASFASIDPGSRLISFPEDDLIAPTPTVERRVFEAAIWVLNPDNNLVPVVREVEEESRYTALLQSLFDDRLRSDALELGLRSAIPLDSEFTNFDIQQTTAPDGTSFGLAIIDLAGDRTLPRVDQPDERLYAVAQIVYTLTGLSEIDQVLISIDGLYLPMPTQFGETPPFNSEQPVGLQRSDFSQLAPDVEAIDRVAPTATMTPAPASSAESDESDASSVAPTPTLTPTATPALTPTPTPTPTPTVVLSLTPAPTLTPGPTPTQEP